MLPQLIRVPSVLDKILFFQESK